MLPQRGKGRPAGNSVHLKGPFQSEVSHFGIIIGNRFPAGTIPHQGLSALCIPHVGLLRTHQVGSVRALLQVGSVIDPHLVHNHIGHGQSQRPIGPHPDGHPLGRLGGGKVAHGIHHHELHPPLPGLGRQLDVRARSVARPVPLGGSEVNRVVAVFEIRHQGPGSVEDPPDQVGTVAAVQPSSGHPMIGSTKGPRKDLNGDTCRGVRRRTLDEELARIILADLAQALRDLAQRFLPGDLFPARIDPESLLGIRTAQGNVDPVGIVQGHDAARAFGAQPSHPVSALGISFNLDQSSVHAVPENRASPVAHAAGGRDPAIFGSWSRSGRRLSHGIHSLRSLQASRRLQPVGDRSGR